MAEQQQQQQQQRVALSQVERLSRACIRILGGNPGPFTLQGSNTYLVGTGAERLLIDTGDGRPSWIAAVKKTLAEESGARIRSVLITHGHADHLGGLKQVSDELGDGIVVYKKEPAPAPAGQLDIADGQTFVVEGASLRALHTPGHTTDHVVFLFAEEDAMFSGDNVLGHGTAIFEDLAGYLASLARMRDTAFGGRIYPGHGPVVGEGVARISHYIQHRAEREEQVRSLLQSQPDLSSAQLVRAIYPGLPPAVSGAAVRGLVQIREKLEKEGRL